MKAPLDAPAIRYKAMTLLSRREYSRYELYQKLKSQAVSIAVLNEELDRLQDDGYQNDQRFAESFVRQRVSQYWGPKRIVYELQQKGLSKSLINQVMQEMEVDWQELANALMAKKIAVKQPLSPQEQAKWLRFLLNHGFDYDVVRQALKPDLE